MPASRIRLPLLLVAVTTSFVLAGCVPSAPSASSATPSASPRPSVVASPTPSPSISAAPPAETPVDPVVWDPMPTVDRLVIETGGLGSLRIGAPAADSGMVVWDPDHCDLAEYGGDIAGRWISAYAGYDAWSLFSLSTDPDDQTVSRVDIRGDGLRTPEGIRIGSTVDDLVAAYPDLVAGPSDSRSDVWSVTGPDGMIMFESGGVEYGEVDAAGERLVSLISIWRVGTEVHQRWATDNVAGTCI